MNRKDFYFKQKVKKTELNAAFDDVENALASFLAGFGYVGICAGAEVTENSPTNMTVVVSGPATIYDQNQKHIQWFPNQVVDLTLDENGSATDPPTIGYKRWLSIFAEFDEVLSDPRVDGNDDTKYFLHTESFKLNVVAGAESGGSPTKPPLRGNQILLADVKIEHGQTSVDNGDIDTDRAQLVYDLTGTPLAVRARSLQDVLQQMIDAVNGYDSGDIAADAISGSPLSLSSGTVKSQLTALLGDINTVKTDLAASGPLGAGFTVGGSGANTDPATITMDAGMDSASFSVVSNEIIVPDKALYLVTIHGVITDTSTANPQLSGVLLFMGAAYDGIYGQRFSATPGNVIPFSGTMLAVVDPGAAEKIKVTFSGSGTLAMVGAKLYVTRLHTVP